MMNRRDFLGGAVVGIASAVVGANLPRLAEGRGHSMPVWYLLTNEISNQNPAYLRIETLTSGKDAPKMSVRENREATHQLYEMVTTALDNITTATTVRAIHNLPVGYQLSMYAAPFDEGGSPRTTGLKLDMRILKMGVSGHIEEVRIPTEESLIFRGSTMDPNLFAYRAAVRHILEVIRQETGYTTTTEKPLMRTYNPTTP